jgi:hypothetical protein
MVTAHRICRYGSGLAVLGATLIAISLPRMAAAQIQDCPGVVMPAGDKIVIGSVTELVGSVGARISMALQASFEMQFEMASAELGDEVTIIHCDKRQIRESGMYDEAVVENLNDQQLLLEVGASPDNSDIMVTYVLIPIRHYAFESQPSEAKGFHQAHYERSQISAGLDKLFKGNAELKLMAALALALRHEKIAEVESDDDTRRTSINRSRLFYCEAVGTLEAAKPRPEYLGLPESEWDALAELAVTGARRMFDTANNDDGYAGALTVVEFERAGATADCVAL